MALTRPRAAQIYDIDYKQATRVVTVANITLSGGAPSLVDGVTLSLNDRVLVTGQSTLSQNGIYYVTTLGSGSNGTWSRSLDTNNTGEILSGTIVMVTEGTIYHDTQWKLITDGVINVGVTDQVWTQNYSANSISSGNSNVIVNSNANVTVSSAGVANVLNITSTGPIVTGNLLPSANITYNLGSTDLRWKDLWLSNSTLYLGNVTVGATANTLTVNGSNVLTAPANADIQTAGNISAAGNITGNYFLGNVFYANGITASKIYSGNSEVNVTASGGNVNVSIGGTSNVAVFSTAGEYVSGIISATGNITGGNILTGGLISATGNVTGGNLLFGSGIVSGTGNLAGNVITATTLNSTTVSASANVTGGNVLTGGLVSATGNATAGNVLTAGQVSATANVTGGNILTGGLISATGNITGNYLFGNGSQITGIVVSAGAAITNGNSNVSVGANSNVSIAVNGISNIAVFAATGEYVTGVVSATGNITGNYYFGNGSLLSGIITSVSNINNGTSNVTVLGANANISVGVGGTGNVAVFATTGEYVTGVVSATGNVTGNYIIGNGSQLTGLPAGYANSDVASYLASGTVSTDIKTTSLISATGNVTGGNILTAGLVSATGNITGNYYFGNGSLLSGIITSVSNINNGTSNVTVLGANANISVGVGGTSNVAVFATTGEYVTGVVSATGNITGGNILTGGLVSATGNATAGNVLTGGLISATGSIIGAVISIPAGALTLTNQGSVNDIIAGTKNVGQVIIGGATQTGAITVGQSTATQTLSLASGVTSSGNTKTISIGQNGASASNTNITMGPSAGVGTVNIGSGTTMVIANTSGTALSVAGNITGGNISATNHTGTTVSVTGNVTGNYFIGNGSALTGTTGVIWTTVANTAPSSPKPGDFWYNSYTDVKYQYTNDGTANYWVDQSYPTSFSTLAVTGAATIGTTLNVTGNTTSGNLLTGGLISATANVTGGNVLTSGLISATGNVTGGNVTTVGLISATGNVTGNYILGNGSLLTGLSGTSITNGTSNVVVAASGNVSIAVTGNNIITVTAAGIINNLANGTGNIGNATGYFNTAFVKATSAQYADLAEYYVTDQAYPPGTVLVFGGTAEVTVSDQSHDTRTAGVVSTDPAYIMNATAVGLTVPVALTGRVPCRVLGPVDKGDRLVNIQSGVAGRLDLNLYQPGAIIGKSLEDIADNTIKTIEIAVGRY